MTYIEVYLWGVAIVALIGTVVFGIMLGFSKAPATKDERNKRMVVGFYATFGVAVFWPITVPFIVVARAFEFVVEKISTAVASRRGSE